MVIEFVNQNPRSKINKLPKNHKIISSRNLSHCTSSFTTTVSNLFKSFSQDLTRPHETKRGHDRVTHCEHICSRSIVYASGENQHKIILLRPRRGGENEKRLSAGNTETRWRKGRRKRKLDYTVALRSPRFPPRSSNALLLCNVYSVDGT